MANQNTAGTITISFHYEQPVLARWIKKTDRYSSKNIVYLILFAILALNFLVVLPAATHQMMPLFLAVVCIFMFFYILNVLRKSTRSRIESLYAGGKEYRVFFKRDGITITQEEKERTLEYAGKVKVYVHPEFYHIRFNDNGLFIIPKAALTAAQAAAVEQTMQKQLDKNYKVCAAGRKEDKK